MAGPEIMDIAAVTSRLKPIGMTKIVLHDMNIVRLVHLHLVNGTKRRKTSPI